MKQYESIQVNHHKDVGKATDEWQNKGWRLYSYAVAGSPNGGQSLFTVREGRMKTLLFSV